MNSFNGLPVILSLNLRVGPFEDWSRVRSPGRAARRRKRGHPQRICLYWTPDPNAYQTAAGLVMHPATAAKLKERLRAINEGEGA